MCTSFHSCTIKFYGRPTFTPTLVFPLQAANLVVAIILAYFLELNSVETNNKCTIRVSNSACSFIASIESRSRLNIHAMIQLFRMLCVIITPRCFAYTIVIG